jgi:hypothetical protein
MDFDPVKKIVPFTVFFVVANPATFKLTRSIAGSWVAAADGLPTTAGLLLHALVFVIVAHFLWRLVWGSKKSGFGGWQSKMNGNPFTSQQLSQMQGARSTQGTIAPEEIDGADCQ